jgi:O-antigen ligase
MMLNSGTLTRAFPADSVAIEPGRLRRLILMVLWAPSIILTWIVHVLCQPLTRRILVSAVILDIPLQWGTHIATRTGVAAMGAMDGFDVSITTVSLLGLYMGWLFTERTQRNPIRIVWNWPIAGYTAAVCISLVAARDLQLALYEAFLMLEMLFLYLYLAANIKSRGEIRGIIRLILVGGILESAYMLGLAAVGHEVGIVRALGFKSVIYHPTGPGEVLRFGGTVGSPNSAAAYLAMVITMGLMARFLGDSPRARRLILPLLVLATIALALTLSRGGWIEAVVSASILTGAAWVRTGLTLERVVAFAMALLIASALFYVPNPVSKRLTGSDNGSAYSRVPLMHLADHMIAEHPMLGVGANNFAAVMRNYEGPEFRHAWLYTVHNQFLLVWSETGLIGVLAYVWIFVSLIRRGWRLWKGRDGLFAPLGLGVVAVACGLLSHMLVEDFTSRPIIQFVWVLAALVAGCELIQARERNQDTAVKEESARAEMSALTVRQSLL